MRDTFQYEVQKVGRAPYHREDKLLGHTRRGYPIVQFESRGFTVHRILDHTKPYMVNVWHNPDGSLHSIYIDVCTWHWTRGGKHVVVEDLMADIIVYPDGRWVIVDLDEAGEKGRRGKATPRQLSLSMENLHKTLHALTAGEITSDASGQQVVRPIGLCFRKDDRGDRSKRAQTG